MGQYRLEGFNKRDGSDRYYEFLAKNDDAAWESEIPAGFLFMKMLRLDGSKWVELKISRERLLASLRPMVERLSQPPNP